MIYLYAFLLSGLFCMVAQIILDNTKLTPGHITASFTVIGAILSFLGIYSKLIKYCGAGATILITNFGNMLYQSGFEGFKNSGFLGIFKELLSKSSLAIVSVIVFSFIFLIIFRPKD